MSFLSLLLFVVIIIFFRDRDRGGERQRRDCIAGYSYDDVRLGLTVKNDCSINVIQYVDIGIHTRFGH